MTTLLKDAKRTVKNWWLFLIMGIFMIIGGIYIMFIPVESYLALSVFFSVMVFVNGIFDIIFSISNHKVLKGWGWHLAGGILEVLMGVILMIHPGLTMAILPVFLGFWLMFGAVSTISSAFDLKSYHVKGWGWVLVLGILLMIFSFMVIANPIFGSGTIVIMTSIAIISYGISYVMFGLELRKVKVAVHDIKKTVIDGLDDLKKQVIASIQDANENAAASEDVGKKFDSFKDSVS